MTPNVAAMLATIASSEGTASQPDPYRVVYGYVHVIRDLSDHPAVTGEWKGERLPDCDCIPAGFSPPCFSTAAGKYQITKPTWLRLKGILRLNTFGPDSQDDACVQLIKERGALDLVNGGQFVAAIAKCHAEWASLPGSTSGQPQSSMAKLVALYTAAGGGFA